MNEQNQDPYYWVEVSGQELLDRYKAGERCFKQVEIAEGSDLRNSILEGATFLWGMVSHVDFQGANLRNVRFLNCNVKCSDFRGADLQGAIFKGSLLEAAYFGGANLNGVSFEGSFIMSHELKASDMPDPDDEGQF